MNRKTQITIETRSITIIRTSGRPLSAHCEHCLKTVPAFAPEQIAAFLRVEPAEVYHRVETKQIHFINEESDAMLIYGGSLNG